AAEQVVEGAVLEEDHDDVIDRRRLGSCRQAAAQQKDGDQQRPGPSSWRHRARSSSKGPVIRRTSFSLNTPRRTATTKRSPATPARRVSGVIGAKQSVRGASLSVKMAKSTAAPSGVT